MIKIKQIIPKIAGSFSFCALLTKTGSVWISGQAFAEEEPKLIAFDEPIVDIRVYLSCLVALSQSGQVYVVGTNRLLLSGLTYANTYQEPQQITGLPAIKAITLGSGFLIALDKHDQLLSAGCNEKGQLGLGHTRTETSFQLLQPLSPVKAIVSGASHTLALLNNNELMAWGDNQYGQLGIGGQTACDLPQRVEGIEGTITDIAAGDAFSVVLTQEGDVYTWGQNNVGQLGQGDTYNRNQPKRLERLPVITTIQVMENACHLLSKFGEILAFGAHNSEVLGQDDKHNKTQPVKIEGQLLGKRVLLLTGFGYNALALTQEKDKYSIYGWGSNENKLLGFDTAKSIVMPKKLENSPIATILTETVITCYQQVNPNFKFKSRLFKAAMTEQLVDTVFYLSDPTEENRGLKTLK